MVDWCSIKGFHVAICQVSFHRRDRCANYYCPRYWNCWGKKSHHQTLQPENTCRSCKGKVMQHRLAPTTSWYIKHTWLKTSLYKLYRISYNAFKKKHGFLMFGSWPAPRWIFPSDKGVLKLHLRSSVPCLMGIKSMDACNSRYFDMHTAYGNAIIHAYPKYSFVFPAS